MINLQCVLEDGSTVMVYDVHPRSQEADPQGVEIPAGTVRIVVWLGTK